jgi:hypothetical protein
MPQEDYFKREIDKLGKVLAKVLSDLLNLKSDNKINDGIELTNQVFQSELDISIAALSEIPENEVLPFLTLTKKLSNIQIELIADILTEVADNTEVKRSMNYYKKAILLYKYITENETDYSVHRHYKIESIERLIRNLNK